MENIKPYDKYKPSGISWLGNIPDHWEQTDIRKIFIDNKIKNEGSKENNLLTLSYGKIKSKDINTADGLLPASFASYQVIDKGDIILRLLDLQNDKNSLRVGYVDKKGIITSAYIGLKTKGNINSKYYYYLLHFLDTIKHFYNCGSGVRQSMGFSELGKEKIILQTIEEQIAIAKFLDYKLPKIDSFIHKKKQLIKLLNEQKTAIITQAVTKGLDKGVPMKDSGIESVGIIPKHWKVLKNKYLHKINMGQSPASEDYNFERKGTPFLQGNAEFGKLNPSPKTWCNTANKICLESDILLSVRAPIGAVNIANQQFGIGRGLCSITCDSHLMYWFYQFTILKERLNSIGTGSTYFAISIDDVKNILLINPPNEEKQAIIKFISDGIGKLDNTIFTTEKEIALTQEYRTALIAEAVTGKIDVRAFVIPIVSPQEELYEEIEEELDMVAEDAESYENE